MQSMTGFGRGSASGSNGTVTVEVAGVNRKQAEVIVQGIRDLADIEAKVRKAALGRVARGRLQISITLEPLNGDNSGMVLDTTLAMQLDAIFAELSETLGREVKASAADFLRSPDIIRFKERGLEPEQAWELIEPALEEALVQFFEMRQREGSELASDLRARLAELTRLKSDIETLAPQRPKHHREALLKRLSDLDLDLNLDDERVLREVALFADRCDISEEITRLDAHFRAFLEFLDSRKPVGRPLDFLCQEINRELNTIGSKASDAGIARHVVNAKTELEKVREQVQNLE